MKTKTTLKSLAFSIRLLIAAGVAIMMIAFAPASRAGLNGPYQVDGNTLHLWHLQETSAGIFYDSVSNQNPQTYAINMTNTPGPNGCPQFEPPYLVPGYNSTNLSVPGQPGAGATFPTNYGYAYAVVTKPYSCLYDNWYSPVYNGSSYVQDAAPINDNDTNICNFVNTNTGAFTFEALIQPQVDLATYSAESSMYLINGDNPGAAGTPVSSRGWLWRIDYNGGKPELDFEDGAPQAGGGSTHTNIYFYGLLPTTGPDAIATAPPWPWYHMAVAWAGGAPTNGDTPRLMTFYWTKVDPTRTNGYADVLTNFPNALSFTNASAAGMLNWSPNTLCTGLYPSNSLYGTPFLAIGGSAHGNTTNDIALANGFLGAIEEVRISECYRHSNEFMFNSQPAYLPPTIGLSATNNLVGYGQTFTLSASETGTQPILSQWYYITNGVATALAGQTNTTLVISNVTYADSGYYQLFAMNAYGSTNSILAQLTIGATFDGLFNTGCGTNNNPLDQSDPGSVDLHWMFPPGGNPYNNSPNCIVWSDDNGPLQSGGGLVPNNGAAVWIGPKENGPSLGITAGTYTFQTTFQVDETAITTNTAISGSFGACGAVSGSTMQMFLNGVETDFTMPLNPQETLFNFTLANGLQAGSNTLQCTAYQNGGDYCALYLAISSDTAAALTTAPSILNAPVGVTNVYGSTVSFQAVATGAPPLMYYWLSNGVAITPPVWAGTALPYLSFVTTNITLSQVVGTNFFANYQIVFSNSLGTVTSPAATLDVQLPPQTLLSAGVPIWDATNYETNIVVYFSQAADPVTGTTAGNYSLIGGPGIISAVLGGAPGEVVLTTSAPLNPDDFYTLSVQNVKSSLGTFLTPSPASVAVGTYPANVGLWVKASVGVQTDSTGTNVTQWNDLSGNNNNLQNGDGVPYDPILVTNNGQPAIEFIGTNETFLEALDGGNASSLEITSNLSVFAVVNFATLAGGTNGEIVGKTGSSSENIAAPYDYYANSGVVTLLRGNGSSDVGVQSTSLPSTGVTHVLDVVMNGTSVTHRLDGIINGTGTLTTTIADQQQPVFIGTREDGYNRLTGDMYELILVGSALSSSDVASMENYLATEYNISQHSPIPTTPTNIVFSIVNNQLTLSWPTNYIGWQLQAQTNPVSVGIYTNWANYDPSTGSSTTTNQIVVPINLTNGTVFYRLIYTP